MNRSFPNSRDEGQSNENEIAAEAVRDELGALRPLELRPEVLRQYSPLGGFELGEHGENFAAAVWLLTQTARLGTPIDGFPPEVSRRVEQARDRLETIVSWLGQLTPRAINSITVQHAPTNEVIFSVVEEPYDKPVTARSLSDGTLRFAALAVAVLGTSGRQTLLVEEVENGINPTRLNLLIRMLERATSTGPDVQVLASTHSPGVLDSASHDTVKNAIVLGWDNEAMCSTAITIGELPVEDQDDVTVGQLQAEGWLQLAANR